MLLGQRPARRHRAGLVVDARSRGLVFWKRGEPCFREHPRLGSRVPGRLRFLVARATRFRATSRRPARALPPATTPSSLRVVRLHGAHSIAMRSHANLRSHARRRTRAPRHEPRVLFPWPDSAPAAALSRPCHLHAHPASPSDAPRSPPEAHWERRGHRSAARATANAPLKVCWHRRPSHRASAHSLSPPSSQQHRSFLAWHCPLARPHPASLLLSFPPTELPSY